MCFPHVGLLVFQCLFTSFKWENSYPRYDNLTAPSEDLLRIWETTKISPKMTENYHFWTFSDLKTVHTIRSKFFTIILHHIRVLYVQWYQNRMTGFCETAKISPKWPNDNKVGDLFFNILIRFRLLPHMQLWYWERGQRWKTIHTCKAGFYVLFSFIILIQGIYLFHTECRLSFWFHKMRWPNW